MSDPLLTLREYAKLAPWNVRDLSALAGGILAASGVTPINAAAQSRPSDRTIRFYVTHHIMSAPDGRGTAAIYGYRHLLQLLAIKLRQMEGATLTAIARELAESTGDVLEMRVASSLGTVAAPQSLDIAESGALRGRVAKALADQQLPRGDDPTAVFDAGAWYHFGVGDGAQMALRHDHPAARSAGLRRKVADAVARALREATPDAEEAEG